MGRRKSRTTRVTAEEATRDEAIRAKYLPNKPSLKKLLKTEEYSEPARQEDFLAGMQLLGKLKQLRQEQGLSLADVSDASGIDRAAISRLENGVFGNPTLRTLETYARALGVRMQISFVPVSDGKTATRQSPSPRRKASSASSNVRK